MKTICEEYHFCSYVIDYLLTLNDPYYISGDFYLCRYPLADSVKDIYVAAEKEFKEIYDLGSPYGYEDIEDFVYNRTLISSHSKYPNAFKFVSMYYSIDRSFYR